MNIFSNWIRNFEIKKELKKWCIAEISNDQLDLSFVIRIRLEKPDYDETYPYGQAILITWNCSETETGFPDKEEMSSIFDFEEATEFLWCDNGNSYLMQTKSGENAKEWLLYAKDRDIFLKDYNRAVKTLPPYPVRIEFPNDPEWDLWKTTLKAVKTNI